MKFTIGNKAAVKAYDFDAAVEAIADGYSRMSDAYEQLVAAEGRCAEAEQVMENCNAALEAIQRFGVTNTTMAVFNGEGNLDQALGLESLDVSALESLSTTTKKLRKEKYVAGLEGKVDELWGKFVQFLKDLWEKIKRFFKELLDSNAKYVRLVTEAVKLGTYNGIDEKSDKKMSLITPTMCTKCLDAAAELLRVVKLGATAAVIPTPDANILKDVGMTVADGKIDSSKLNDTIKKVSGTFAECKWTKQAVKGIADGFVKCAVGADLKAAMQAIDKTAQTAIDVANKAKDDAKAAEAAKAKKAAMVSASSYISAYKKLVDRVGTTLVAIAKMPKTAKPEEPKKDPDAE